MNANERNDLQGHGPGGLLQRVFERLNTPRPRGGRGRGAVATEYSLGLVYGHYCCARDRGR